MDLRGLDLIDLISERHLFLRDCIEKRWEETNDVYISLTEWHILARLMEGLNTAASLTKRVNISRQATHKIVKNLEQKQLLEIIDAQNNKKEKHVQITAYGITCYKEYMAIKQQLEQEMIAQIGLENFQIVKQVLAIDWKIQS